MSWIGKGMNIGIDLDEVIADFMSALLNFYYKKTGKLHSKEEFKEYKWWPVWGVSREEAIKITDEFHEAHNVKDIKTIENSIKGINLLLEKGDNLIVITARPIRYKQKVEEWIYFYLGKKLEIIHSGDFHKGQAVSKSEICNNLGIKAILEDSGETALDCAKNGIRVILFDKPWNKKFKHENIIRVKDWDEAIKKIEILRE